jgi:hypothetical protein
MDKAQQTFGSSTARLLDDQPLLIAIGGFAAGALMAAAFPTSDLEKQTFGPIGEQFSEEASRFGGQLKETASKAAGTLKTATQEHIFEPDGVKKIVTEVTEAVREGMRGEPRRENANPSGDQSGGNKG